MKKLISLALVSMMLAANSGMVLASGKDTKIVMEGSTTVLPIAQKAAEEFMNNNPDVDINVRGGGSGVGITSIIEGTCDIGDASRPIKDAELANAAGKGRDIKAHVIAMDGIAVIVNPQNSVSALSKQQVMDIFTGKISNWSKLGGKDAKIVVVSRDSASGTFEAFGALALAGKKVRSDALMQASNQAVATIISKTPDAIGYVGVGYITEAVKALPINGISASKITVLSGKYPYSRPLFMYTNGQPQGKTKEFIDFILSKDGQKIVEEEGFVGLK